MAEMASLLCRDVRERDLRLTPRRTLDERPDRRAGIFRFVIELQPVWRRGARQIGRTAAFLPSMGDVIPLIRRRSSVPSTTTRAAARPDGAGGPRVTFYFDLGPPWTHPPADRPEPP